MTTVDSISVGRFDQNQAVQRLSLSPGKNEMEISSFFVKHFRHRLFSIVFGGVFELHSLRNA
jgi:hypothetical protein